MRSQLKSFNFPLFIILVLAFSITACTTEMSIVIDQAVVDHNFEPKPVEYEVHVIEVDEEAPSNAVFLAKLKLRDKGLTVDCTYENVLAQALGKARELGGDLIQITQVYAPDWWSTCFRLDVNVYALPPSGTTD